MRESVSGLDPQSRLAAIGITQKLSGGKALITRNCPGKGFKSESKRRVSWRVRTLRIYIKDEPEVAWRRVT